MKKTTKRWLSLMLTLVMLVGMVPAFELTARAATTTVSTWADLQNALAAGGDIILGEDVTAGDGDSELTVPSTATATLNLNGHTINANNKFSVLNVRGSLALNDTSADKKGTLTGGNATNGGGVYVYSRATFTMSGGEITGNKATNGGGVYVYSSSARFTMSGGEITRNTASGNGGGVYANGIFTMTGGSITGNTATDGGGVYNYREFMISGDVTITGNNADNVSLNSIKITVIGTLAETSKIGVNNASAIVFTSGLRGKGTINSFFSDSNNFGIVEDNNGEAKLDDLPVPVTGVTLNKTSTTLPVGDTETLTATVLPENAADKSITWSSSDETVATVDNGVVNAVAAGTANITVTTNDGSFTDTCAVTVVPSCTVTFDPNNGENSFTQKVVEGGKATEPDPAPTKEGYALMGWKLNGADYDFNTAVNADITLTAAWASYEVFDTNTGAATYTGAHFKISPSNAGDTDGMTVSYGDPVTISSLNGEIISKIDMTIGFYGGNGRAQHFSSDHGTLSDVDDRNGGGFSFIDVNSTRATITSGDYALQIKKVVVYYTVPVSEVTLNKTSTTLTVGDTETLTATVLPENAADKSVTWSSNNTDVATVDENGLVTAVAAGSATITVTTNDGSFTDTCEVTVNAPAIDTWEKLQTALAAGGDIVLGDNVTAGDNDTALEVPSDKTVTLDLNGYEINANNKFSVLTVKGDLTLNDNSADKKGKLTGGGSTEYGGGVYVVEGGTFSMNGGSITGNTGEYGGGVYTENIFTMTSGSITGNTATYGGGGVYIYEGTFEMSGGSIDKNGASSGGGVFDYDTFTMTGGSITENTATNSGGGVYVARNGSFEMSGGDITGNKANEDEGGGVYINSNGTFTMSGGEITENVSVDDYAGGVYVSEGSSFTMSDGSITGNTGEYGGVYTENIFTMNGGSITGNTATEQGGGVYVDGTFTMNGGSITGNTATSGGGGVYHYGEFKISGDVTITGNNADNVYLYSNSRKITVTGTLAETSKIGVNSNSSKVFTEGLSDNGTINNFISDTDNFGIVEDNGEAKLVAKYTVTFMDDDETTVLAAAQTVVDGGTATEPDPAPTKAGFEFDGWYNGDTKFTFDTEITENITLYANWSENDTIIDWDSVSIEFGNDENGLYAYTGEEIEPTIKVMYESEELQEGMDFEFTDDSDTFASTVGLHTITITSIDGGEGESKTIQWYIYDLTVTSADVNGSDTKIKFTAKRNRDTANVSEFGMVFDRKGQIGENLSLENKTNVSKTTTKTTTTYNVTVVDAGTGVYAMPYMKITVNGEVYTVYGGYLQATRGLTPSDTPQIAPTAPVITNGKLNTGVEIKAFNTSKYELVEMGVLFSKNGTFADETSADAGLTMNNVGNGNVIKAFLNSSKLSDGQSMSDYNVYKCNISFSGTNPIYTKGYVILKNLETDTNVEFFCSVSSVTNN